jgi:hypothetical protein
MGKCLWLIVTMKAFFINTVGDIITNHNWILVIDISQLTYCGWLRIRRKLELLDTNETL